MGIYEYTFMYRLKYTNINYYMNTCVGDRLEIFSGSSRDRLEISYVVLSNFGHFEAEIYSA